MRQSDVVITPDHSYDIRLVAESHELNKYPAKQHAQRVFQHLATSAGLIYLEGQPTGNWGDSDQPRPFRQRRYFYYLSGVEESDCYLTYDIKIDLLTLYIPDFDLHRAIWMGPTITVEEAQVKYDVDRVRYYACLQSDIDDWIRSHDDTSPIFVLHGSQVPRTSSTTVRFDAERLLPAVDAAREIKDEHEIQMIRHANKISDQAHRQVLENIHRITNETEIEALFLEACVARGAKHQSYEIIAGSGENAAVLHYVKNDEALKDRQLVCLDAGAEWNCYASDVTRTFPLATEDGDWPSREAREIYDLVQNIQTECIRRIKAGTRFLDLQLATHEWVVKGLLKLGILTGGDETELGQSGVSRVFFPHGLGHHIGLEVHDVSAKPITAGQQQQQQSSTSNNSSISSSNNQPLCATTESTLKEGMVITVEPGIYFSRYALTNAKTQPVGKYIDFEVVERYVPVGGVRIEDDILVTARGNENLTTAPKGEEMMKIVRSTSV